MEAFVDELSYHIDRENEKCERHCKEQLARLERCGTEHLAAEVDKGYLYRADGGHDQTECGIFGYSAEKTASVRAAVEAVEYRGEDEKREKGGQKVDVIIRVANA